MNPVLAPGMAIVFSIDKFMSEVRALTNITGNGIATVFVSWWEGELDHDLLQRRLNQQIDPSDVETAVTTGLAPHGDRPRTSRNLSVADKKTPGRMAGRFALDFPRWAADGRLTARHQSAVTTSRPGVGPRTPRP